MPDIDLAMLETKDSTISLALKQILNIFKMTTDYTQWAT